MSEKKEEKDPLDLTTDEALDYLFPPEVVKHLKETVKGEPTPPSDGDNGSKLKSKSARRHNTK
jgi:hypothetical protein